MELAASAEQNGRHGQKVHRLSRPECRRECLVNSACRAGGTTFRPFSCRWDPRSGRSVPFSLGKTPMEVEPSHYTHRENGLIARRPAMCKRRPAGPVACLPRSRAAGEHPGYLCLWGSRGMASDARPAAEPGIGIRIAPSVGAQQTDERTLDHFPCRWDSRSGLSGPRSDRLRARERAISWARRRLGEAVVGANESA